MIESYSFGRIIIDGKRYTSDVIIFPHRVQDGWWRKEGHRVHIEDLKQVLEAKPEVLVVGTGAWGMMKIPKEVKQRLENEGIEVVVQPTKKACETFNQLIQSEKKAVGALHLTC